MFLSSFSCCFYLHVSGCFSMILCQTAHVKMTQIYYNKLEILAIILGSVELNCTQIYQ